MSPPQQEAEELAAAPAPAPMSRVNLDETAHLTTDLEEPLLTIAEVSGHSTSEGAGVSSVASMTSAGDDEEDEDNEQLQQSTPPHDNNDNDKDIVLFLPNCCGRRQHRVLRMNHNVFLNLVLSVLYGMSDSLWTGAVFVAYLKQLGGDHNWAVGDIEAVNGLAVLVSALPVGYLADVYGRDVLIRAGGVLFLVTAVVHASLLLWIGTDVKDMQNDEHKQKWALTLLGVVMALWGVGGGIVSGPCQALYADSTPAGQRSVYYHYLFVAYLVSSCLGPVTSIVLFQTLGDEWNVRQLRTIILIGLAMEAANAVLMLFFDDTKALDEEEEEDDDDEGGERGESGRGTATIDNGLIDTEVADAAATTTVDQAEKGSSVRSSSTALTAQESDLTQPLLTHDTQEEVPVTDASADTQNNNSNSEPQQHTNDTDTNVATSKQRQRWIPYILFCSGLIFSIGSGMTVKFFPLFFKEDVGMSPSQVQLVYVLVPLSMALCSGVGTSVARYLGRVETVLLLQSMGIACLYAMVFGKTFLDAHPVVLVPVYILRTALMNCPYPLVESILMDFVPKKERARWKSLESISQFGWCGSAALGGYVSDHWDYTHTFFVTATIQVVGTVCMVLLLPLVPRSEQAMASTTTTSSAENGEEPQPGTTAQATQNEASEARES